MIEIIPKPVTATPRWQIILFYISIFLVIATIAGYFVLNYLEKKSQDYLDDITKELSEEKAVKITALENEIFPQKEKIDEFAPFLRNHILSTKFFDFLENKTHPQVFFSNTALNLGVDKSEAELSGLIDSFLSLGQQILILSQDSMVKDINLSNVALAKTGGVEFRFNLLLKRDLFKY